jgi:hypothetical protein
MAILQVLIKGEAKHVDAKEQQIGFNIKGIIDDPIEVMDHEEGNGEEKKVLQRLKGGIAPQPEQEDRR